MNISRLGFVCLLVTGSIAHAQQTAPAAAAPAPAAPVAAPAVVASPASAVAAVPDANGMYKLREGEDVPLTFAQDISSKNAADGDEVMFTLAEDVKVGGIVVAKAGAKGVGEVTNVKKAGMMGKAGELNIRLNYLKVGDNKIHLRGSKGKEGDSSTGTAVALTVLFGPIGLIKHGHNIEIKTGQPLKAYVADDVSLPPA